MIPLMRIMKNIMLMMMIMMMMMIITMRIVRAYKMPEDTHSNKDGEIVDAGLLGKTMMTMMMMMMKIMMTMMMMRVNNLMVRQWTGGC